MISFFYYFLEICRKKFTYLLFATVCPFFPCFGENQEIEQSIKDFSFLFSRDFQRIFNEQQGHIEKFWKERPPIGEIYRPFSFQNNYNHHGHNNSNEYKNISPTVSFALPLLFLGDQEPPSFLLPLKNTSLNPFMYYSSKFLSPPEAETSNSKKKHNETLLDNPQSLFSSTMSKAKKENFVECRDILDQQIPAFKNPFTNLIFGVTVTLCLAEKNKKIHTAFQRDILIDFLAALKARTMIRSESGTFRVLLKDFNPTLNQEVTPMFSTEKTSFKKYISCRDVLSHGFQSAQSPAVNELFEFTLVSCWAVEILQKNLHTHSRLLHLKLWTHFLLRTLQNVTRPENEVSFNHYYATLQKEYFSERAYRGLNT